MHKLLPTFLLVPLFAAVPLNTTVDPAIMPTGNVNVVSGDLCDVSQDHVLQSVEPIPIERLHVSGYRPNNHFGEWRFQVHEIRDVKNVGLLLEESDGTVVVFDPQKGTVKNLTGISNTSRGDIGGKTNLRNWRLTWLEKNKKLLLTKGNGEKSYYHKQRQGKFYLHKKVFPSGNQLIYTHEGDRLKEIRLTNHVESNDLGWVRFHRENESGASYQTVVETSDERMLRYTYKHRTHSSSSIKAWLLEEIEFPGERKEQLEYEGWICNEAAFPISEKQREDGTTFKVSHTSVTNGFAPPEGETWVTSPSLGRVYEIREQKSHDDSYQCVAKFTYGITLQQHSKWEKIGKKWRWWHFGPIKRRQKVKVFSYTINDPRWRDVYDAYNTRSRYQIRDHRVKWIDRPDGSTELRAWGSGNEATYLLGKGFSDPDGKAVWCRTFKYDSRGNVLEEKLWGDLTGKAPNSLKFNSQWTPVSSSTEHHTTSHTYSDDDFNNLLSETDGNKTIRYTYKENTDLILSKFICEKNHIRLREFFEYDENAALIYHAKDNGLSADPSTLKGVSVRRVTRITNRQESPAIGLPEIIEERYGVDEKLLKKIHLHYDNHNQVTQTDIYDANNRFAYSTRAEYDASGRVIEERDPLRQLTNHTYDENGNCIETSMPEEGISTQFGYDYANRLITLSKIKGKKDKITRSFTYDLLDRKTSDIDECGNATEYQYDQLGNVIEVRHAPMLEDGEWRFPHVECTYDSQGNMLTENNENGYITKKEYNSRKQVIAVHHPDGTREAFQYALNGDLVKHVNKNGSTTLYERDYLGRILTKKLVAPDGTPLQTTSTTYIGEQKATETDAEGNVADYTYDQAGRLISQTKGNQSTHYTYDPLGHKASQRQGDKITLWKYDFLGRITEQRVEDQTHTLYFIIRYVYDAEGNVTRTTTYQDNRSLHTYKTYDAEGRVTSITDPLKNTTYTSYDHAHIFRGRRVLCVKTTDPKGNTTTHIHDARGKIIQTEKKNAYGKTIAFVHNTYDALGNRIEQTHTVYPSKRKVTTRWKYDQGNRLTKLHEAHGSKDYKATTYLYNKHGQLATTIKPSGIKLERTYDPVGRLHVHSGPDFEYTYEYDCNNNVIAVTSDGVKTLRTYDINNNLTSETLETGLTLSYAYDSQARRTQTTLPRKNVIDYTYDATHLKTVTYNNKTHTYLSYDLRGNLLQEQHISGQTSTYTYDRLGRCTNRTSPEYSQTNINYDKLGNLTSYDDQTYTYDDLNQLKSEKGHKYVHDSLHNRIKHNDTTYAINALNQIANDNFEYDAEGRLTRHNDTLYEYDSLDRLTQVYTPEIGVAFTYDPFNRRLTKTIYARSNDEWKKTSKQFFCYERNCEIGAYSNNELIQLRVLGRGRGAEIGAAVLIILEGRDCIPIHNHQGSITLLLDEWDHPIERYTYTAFGECVTEDFSEFYAHKLNYPHTPYPPNPYRFLSKRYDSETDLTYFGRRYYNASLGRWTTPDPKGYKEGPNLYAYVNNNPLTNVDLWGLESAMLSRRGFGFPSRFNIDHLKPVATHVAKRGFSWAKENIASRFSIGRPENYAVGGKRFVDANGLLTVGTGYTNGIGTSWSRAQANARMLSSFTGGYRVEGTYRPTVNIPSDVLRIGLEHRGMRAIGRDLITQRWMNFIENAVPGAKYLEVCHSGGAAAVRQALLHAPKWVQQRIVVLALGPADHIEKELCHKVDHYESNRDPVPLLSPRRLKCADTIHVVPAAPGTTGFFDHPIDNPTYQGVTKSYFESFFEQYR